MRTVISFLLEMALCDRILLYRPEYVSIYWAGFLIVMAVLMWICLGSVIVIWRVQILRATQWYLDVFFHGEMELILTSTHLGLCWNFRADKKTEAARLSCWYRASLQTARGCLKSPLFTMLPRVRQMVI